MVISISVPVSENRSTKEDIVSALVDLKCAFDRATADNPIGLSGYLYNQKCEKIGSYSIEAAAVMRN